MNYNSVLLPDAMETSLLLNMPTYFPHNEQGKEVKLVPVLDDVFLGDELLIGLFSSWSPCT